MLMNAFVFLICVTMGNAQILLVVSNVFATKALNLIQRIKHALVRFVDIFKNLIQRVKHIRVSLKSLEDC